MTTPTPSEIEARAKADYERHVADLHAGWELKYGTTDRYALGFCDWNSTDMNGDYWNAWRADAREALIREMGDG